MRLLIIGEHIRSYLLAYLVVSLLFSLTVFVRLVFALNMEFLNIILYDVYYYVMPSIAILILLALLRKPESKKLAKWESYVFVMASTFFIAVVSWCLLHIDYIFNTPLSYTVFLLIPVSMTCLYFKGKVSEDRLLSKKIAAFSLAFVILMPYTVVFLGVNSNLSVVRAAQSETERIEFVSDYVCAVTTSFWELKGFEKQYFILHRASSDFLKFLLVGVGSCGEMAHATKALFDNLDLESRVVSFAGEDHMFVEVKLNGTWAVVDPGYQLNLVTREERGSRRLKELGGLSYVVAYTSHGLIELTQYYVKTDRIVIRVMDDGEPIANARIVLRHTFMGNEISLPEFRSDANGTIELNLGPMAYNNSKIEPAEPYYWIYVNDQNTKVKVESTGSGKFIYIQVDLAVVLSGQ